VILYPPTLLCSEVLGDRERYEEDVFHAANQDREINGKDPFIDTPEGKQAGWNYWVERITDRSYWLSSFEMTLLGLLGLVTVMATWDRPSGKVVIRRVLPGGSEERFPLDELSTRMLKEDIPDAIPFYNDRDHYLRAERKITLEFKDDGWNDSIKDSYASSRVNSTAASGTAAAAASGTAAAAASGTAAAAASGTAAAVASGTAAAAASETAAAAASETAAAAASETAAAAASETAAAAASGTAAAAASGTAAAAAGIAAGAAFGPAATVTVRKTFTIELMRSHTLSEKRRLDNAFGHHEESEEVVCKLFGGAAGSTVDILGKHMAR